MSEPVVFGHPFPNEVIDFASKMIKNPDKILIASDEYLVLDVINHDYRSDHRFCCNQKTSG